jgi:hypothetical protein
MSEPPQPGRPPSQEDLYWLELMQEARKESLKSLGEAAKQLIGVVPILSGLYAATLGLAEIEPDYWQAHPDARYVFVAPLLLWVFSLIFAFISLFPQAYGPFNPHSPDDARTALKRLISDKHFWLKLGMVMLISGIFVLLIAVWRYLDILTGGYVSMKE